MGGACAGPGWTVRPAWGRARQLAGSQALCEWPAGAGAAGLKGSQRSSCCQLGYPMTKRIWEAMYQPILVAQQPSADALCPSRCCCRPTGVGAALNVHEGPQSISSRWHITTPLEATMVGRWGVGGRLPVVVAVAAVDCVALAWATGAAGGTAVNNAQAWQGQRGSD